MSGVLGGRGSHEGDVAARRCLSTGVNAARDVPEAREARSSLLGSR